MMKKFFSKVVLATLMVITPLMAGNFSYNTNSLFAIEGGVSDLNAKSAGSGNLKSPDKFGSYGFKLGAESEDFRIFLNANYHDIKDFDYSYTYGGALQYKFNFTEFANFFIGVNGGYANMKKTVANVSTSISDTYFGGDVGFNIHASDLIDIELGGRVMKIDNDNIDNLVTAYSSLIFKFQLD